MSVTLGTNGAPTVISGIQTAAVYPWQAPSGRVSPLKTAVLALLFVPAIVVGSDWLAGNLGGRPLQEALRDIGGWTIRIVFLSLAVTPLRQIMRWQDLTLVRRMIGVAAFVYVVAHVVLYAAEEKFNLGKVATEIVLRIYLLIGFTAVLGLAALAATSTDAIIRRMGARWQRLHRIVYVIGILALVHFFMQAKADLWEPMVMAGMLVWLLGYRALAWAYGARGRLPLVWAAVWTVMATALVAGGEAIYLWLAMGAPLEAVLETNLSFDLGVRPAQLVFAISAGLTLIGAVRAATSASSQRAFARA
jgi:methionine sulfoxide reductase heme-binding subunit